MCLQVTQLNATEAASLVLAFVLTTKIIMSKRQALARGYALITRMPGRKMSLHIIHRAELFSAAIAFWFVHRLARCSTYRCQCSKATDGVVKKVRTPASG